MKKLPRLFSVLIVLIFCLTLAVPVLALTDAKRAGIYSQIRGTYTVDTFNIQLETITGVTYNPDQAYLRTTVEFSNGLDKFGPNYAQSVRGAVQFSYNFPVALMGGFPNYVNTCHEVQGGSSSPVGYDLYLAGDVSFF